MWAARGECESEGWCGSARLVWARWRHGDGRAMVGEGREGRGEVARVPGWARWREGEERARARQHESICARATAGWVSDGAREIRRRVSASGV